MQRALLEAIGQTDPQAVLPEWIFGDGNDGREYLVHMRSPRFTCRIVAEDDESYDPVADDGVKYRTGDLMLCQFVWHQPRPSDIAGLMERASDALNEIIFSEDA